MDNVAAASYEIQRLSPAADVAPSPFLRFRPGATTTLDVAFSYTHTPPGQFTLDGPAAASPNAVLHLNVRDNDYYQRGIPGVTTSIEKTATWLHAVARRIGATTLRLIGASMGGYAALLFTALTDADLVYCFSPVIRPGALDLGLVRDFRDVSPLVPQLASRAVVTFGAFELGEYQYIASCLRAGMKLRAIVFLKNFHPGLLSIDLKTLFGAPGRVPVASLVRGMHTSGLNRGDVAMLADVMDAVVRRDHVAARSMLRVLTKRDAGNPGLLYRLGVHQLLSGRPGAARESFREALRILLEVGHGVLGEDGNLRQKSVRDYAHLLGYEPVRAIHKALAEAAA